MSMKTSDVERELRLIIEDYQRMLWIIVNEQGGEIRISPEQIIVAPYDRVLIKRDDTKQNEIVLKAI